MVALKTQYERHATGIAGQGNQQSGWSLQEGEYHNHPPTGFYKGFTTDIWEATLWVRSGILPQEHSPTNNFN